MRVGTKAWPRGRARQFLLCAAALLVLAGCGKSAPEADKKDDDAQNGVTLTPDQVKSVGIVTAPAQAAAYRQNILGYGVVVALDTVAQTDADVATASATAAQSAAAAARARSLATGEEAAVSKEVAEAAESKAAADQASLALAQRKAQAAFGLHAPWQTAAARKAVMAQLASGQAVLIRATFPLGALNAAKPQQITISRLGTATANWTCKTIWEAPADPALPGSGYYCLLTGSDLLQNEHVTAAVDVGQPLNGVLVPRTALLLGDSDTWAYVEPETGHFIKVRIDTSKPEADGYFLNSGAGITAGEKLVTGGAGLLLARETNPSTDAGD